jgi:imidazolonepropionase-like amidohydrolase
VLPYGIEQLSDVGLTTTEALQANTADAARALGLGDRKGRIAPGFDADLLVVRGNPFEDLARLRDVESVWCAGRVVRDERP